MSSIIQRVDTVLALLKLINYSCGKLWKTTPNKSIPM